MTKRNEEIEKDILNQKDEIKNKLDADLRLATAHAMRGVYATPKSKNQKAKVSFDTLYERVKLNSLRAGIFQRNMQIKRMEYERLKEEEERKIALEIKEGKRKKCKTLVASTEGGRPITDEEFNLVMEYITKELEFALQNRSYAEGYFMDGTMKDANWA